MKSLGKFVLSLCLALGASMAIANVAARACSLDVQEEYTCYVTGEDANYCYYMCYCKVSSARCEAALAANGYESY